VGGVLHADSVGFSPPPFDVHPLALVLTPPGTRVDPLPDPYHAVLVGVQKKTVDVWDKDSMDLQSPFVTVSTLDAAPQKVLI